MKKIVLFSFIGSENLGDEAINLSILMKLAQTNCQIVIISFNPEKTRNLISLTDLQNFSIINIKKRNQVRNAIKGCDLFICGGGGIIQDQSSFYNLIFFIKHISFALRNKRKVMLYGVGVGPIFSNFNKFLVNKYLNRVSIITVRDFRSKEILIDLGVNEKIIEVTADPAISLPDAKPGLPPNENSQHRVMIVCLRHWFDTIRYLPVKYSFMIRKFFKVRNKRYDEFIDKISTAMDEIKKNHNLKIIFFPFWNGRDSIVHRDVYDRMKEKSNTRLIEESLNPIEAIQLFRSADFILGMRLHSVIFAVKTGKKFLAINYSQKVRNFLRMVSIDDDVDHLLIDPSNFSPQELVQKTNLLLKSDNIIGVNKLNDDEKNNYLYVQNLLSDFS